MIHPTLLYRPIHLRPHPLQFCIDKLLWIISLPCSVVFGLHMEYPYNQYIFFGAILLDLWLIYQLLYLYGTIYKIESEQIVVEYGIFHRHVDYLELYRVVDYNEHQTFLQRLCGLKTVIVDSMDKSTPRLEIKGVPNKVDLVAIIRERVELNKRMRRIYEVTNQQ